ncbi:MAG: DUF5689 domain-containing protein [Chitinophagaceae bacterium]
MKTWKWMICCLPMLWADTACVRKNYPVPQQPADTATLWRYQTIAEFKANMGSSGSKSINEAVIISGSVTANDRTGNFYKQIIIDDGTAAIPLLLDGYSLYTLFPEGRHIQIRCKGLTTQFSNKLPQLGYRLNSQGTLLPIPWQLIDMYITKGVPGSSPQPLRVRLSEVRKALPELLNRLVLIDSAEFSDTMMPQSFAVSPDLSSATNLTIRDCDSNTILLRTSGYCSFATVRVPRGKGSIIAVYSVYNNTPQLLLRDTADIHFTDKRCP